MPPLQHPKPPSDLLDRNWWKSLRFLGPGIIIASISIGNGETVFASRGGSIFGYAILWCFLIAIALKGIQLYTSARYMMLSGEHPMQTWMHLPGPRGWLPISILSIASICLPFLLAALSLSVGSLIAWVFHENSSSEWLSRLWASLLIITAAAFSWNQSYKRLERSQTIIVGVLLVCILIAASACQPDLLKLLEGLFVPRVPDYEPWIHAKYPEIAQHSAWVEIATYIGIVGGGLPAYIGYFSFLREKQWGLFQKQSIYNTSRRNQKIAINESAQNQSYVKAWLKAVKVDTIGSLLIVFIFSAAFIVLGAVILHGEKLIPDRFELLSHQENFLIAIHPSLMIVYRIGIFTAIGGTLFAAFDVWSKTVYESILPLVGKQAEINYQKLKRTLVLATSVVGIAIIWIGYSWNPLSNPINVVRIPALLGGTFGCGIWCFGILWADRKNLPPSYQMGTFSFCALGLSGCALLTFGIAGTLLNFF